MKYLTLGAIGVSILAVVVLGAGRVAAAGLESASGMYPQAVQISGKHLNLRSASQGRISETFTYQTTDALAAVLARYVGRYQPEPGKNKPGQCIILRQANSYVVFRQTVLVTLCPSGNGTRIVLYRDLHLGH